MLSWTTERARDKDRDAAIEVVEAAWADGQIIEADRDKRVEQLLLAQTLDEIRMLTHDLQLRRRRRPSPVARADAAGRRRRPPLPEPGPPIRPTPPVDQARRAAPRKAVEGGLS